MLGKEVKVITVIIVTDIPFNAITNAPIVGLVMFLAKGTRGDTRLNTVLSLKRGL